MTGGKRIDPSWQRGFARSAGEALHPGLWKGLIGAWLPALGPSGLTLFDISPYRNHGAFTSLDSTDWFAGEKGYAIATDGGHVDCGVGGLSVGVNELAWERARSRVA